MVDGDSLPKGEFELTHWSGNDGTLEGMVHRTLPVLSVPVPPRGEPRPARSRAVVRGVRHAGGVSARRQASNGRDARATRWRGTRPDAAPHRHPARSWCIGAGPIVIGQACEFDYSGTQALPRAARARLEVVLLNSNPATIMTDPEFADRTYIEPLLPEIAERIIERETPDALLPTLGGQTGAQPGGPARASAACSSSTACG